MWKVWVGVRPPPLALKSSAPVKTHTYTCLVKYIQGHKYVDIDKAFILAV